MANESIKQPVTVRLPPTAMEKLRTLGAESECTVSALINTAIEEFLERNWDKDATVKQVELTFDELQRAVPVVGALGIPVSLAFLLEIIAMQKAKETT